MTARIPPNPSQSSDLRAWARQMYDYILSESRVRQDNNPRPILLSHRSDGSLERASTDGILMYEPLSENVVVSLNGSWVPVSSVSSYTATELADATSTVNTTAKRAGTVVRDSTNNALVVANGSAATATWSRLSVAATITPV